MTTPKKPKLTPLPRRRKSAAPAAAEPDAPPAGADGKPAVNLDHITEDLRPLAVECASISFDPANTRRHDDASIAGVRGSLRSFGQTKPLVVRRADRIVYCGNGTLAAALSLGWTHIAASVKEMDGTTAARLSIADNATGDLSDFDADKLLAQLAALPATNDPDLDRMLAELKAENTPAAAPPASGAGGDDFDAAAVAGPCRVQAGELWLIDAENANGGHRLLCGDSTDAASVARLMDGEKAALCFTSPPYLQQRDYGEKAKEQVQDWYALMCGVFANLPMADDGQVLVNLGLVHRDGEWVPYWDPWIQWMREQGWKRFGWYVWDQGWGLPGDWNGRLGPSHEFVFHFNRQAIRPEKWVGTKPESQEKGKKSRERMNRGEFVPATRGADGEVKEMSSSDSLGQTHKIPDSVLRISRSVVNDVARANHPATFPVELSSFVIHTWPGDVYEPFAGSGTTLIAAHRLGQRSFLCEIDPKYCDVALRRAEAEGLTVARAP